MIKRSEIRRIQQEAHALLAQTGLALNEDEIARMEVADFGLSEIRESGAQIVTLVDTAQIAAKLLVMLPWQCEPEHTHPTIGDYAGKEETIRCEWGTLFLYGPGETTPNPQGRPPAHRRHTYSVWHEHILKPGQQVTFRPGTPHWFQGGPEGCVFWSLSTKVIDANDVFTDPEVRRLTEIFEDEPNDEEGEQDAG